MLFFNKKEKNKKKCENCGNHSPKIYTFCPHCGNNFAIQNETRDFGLLGKSDFSNSFDEAFNDNSGFMNKAFFSLINNLMKNLDQQFKNELRETEKFQRAEIRSLPSGIKIKIAGPFEEKTLKVREKQTARQINEATLQKMSSLPKQKAKANLKRIGDRVIYELLTPGVTSADDVFVSKLESGYEIKAVGNKRVYVNSLPINLPMKKFSILKNKLLIEFIADEE